MIKFPCPNCKNELKVKDEFAGRQGKCPKCNQVLLVPRPKTEGEDDFIGFDDDLDEHMPPETDDHPTEQAPPPPPAESTKSKKPMVILGLAAAIGVISMIGALWWYFSKSDTPDTPRKDRRTTAARTSSPQRKTLSAGQKKKIQADFTAQLTDLYTQARQAASAGQVARLLELKVQRDELIEQARENIGPAIDLWKQDADLVSQAEKLISQTRYDQAVTLLNKRWQSRRKQKPLNGELGMALAKAALSQQALDDHWGMDRKALQAVLQDVTAHDPMQVEAVVLLAWLTRPDPKEELLRMELRPSMHQGRNVPLLRLRSALGASGEAKIPADLYRRVLAPLDYTLGSSRFVIRDEFIFWKTVLNKPSLTLLDAGRQAYLLDNGVLWKEDTETPGGWLRMDPVGNKNVWRPCRLMLVRVVGGEDNNRNTRNTRQPQRGQQDPLAELDTLLQRLKPIKTLPAIKGRSLEVYASNTVTPAELREAAIPMYRMNTEQLALGWGQSQNPPQPTTQPATRPATRPAEDQAMETDGPLILSAQSRRTPPGGMPPMPPEMMPPGATPQSTRQRNQPVRRVQDRRINASRRPSLGETGQADLGFLAGEYLVYTPTQADNIHWQIGAGDPLPTQLLGPDVSDELLWTFDLQGTKVFGILQPLEPESIELVKKKDFRVRWDPADGAGDAWPDRAELLAKANLLRMQTAGGLQVILPLVGSNFNADKAIAKAARQVVNRSWEEWTGQGQQSANRRNPATPADQAARITTVIELVNTYGQRSNQPTRERIITASLTDAKPFDVLDKKRLGILTEPQKQQIAKDIQQRDQIMQQLEQIEQQLKQRQERWPSDYKQVNTQMRRARGDQLRELRIQARELRRERGEIRKRLASMDEEKQQTLQRLNQAIEQRSTRFKQQNVLQAARQFLQGTETFRGLLAAMPHGLDLKGRLILYVHENDSRRRRATRRVSPTRSQSRLGDDAGELVFIGQTGQPVQGISYSEAEVAKLLDDARSDFILPSWAMVPTPAVTPHPPDNARQQRRTPSRRQRNRRGNQSAAPSGNPLAAFRSKHQSTLARLQGQIAGTGRSRRSTQQQESALEEAYDLFLEYCVLQADEFAEQKNYHMAATLYREAPIPLRVTMTFDATQTADRDQVIGLQQQAEAMMTAGVRKVQVRHNNGVVLRDAGRPGMARELMRTALGEWKLIAIPFLKQFEYYSESYGYGLQPSYRAKAAQLGNALQAMQQDFNKLDKTPVPKSTMPAPTAEPLLQKMIETWTPVRPARNRLVKMNRSPQNPQKSPMAAWLKVYRSDPASRDYYALRQQLLNLAAKLRQESTRNQAITLKSLAKTYNAIGTICLAAATDEFIDGQARFDANLLKLLLVEIDSILKPRLQVAGLSPMAAAQAGQDLEWMVTQAMRIKSAAEYKQKRYYWLEYAPIADGFFPPAKANQQRRGGMPMPGGMPPGMPPH